MPADFSQGRQLLDTLRQSFIAQLPTRLAAIEQCWVDCYMAADPLPALHELLRLAHSLRGSARTYGLMPLGEAAGDLEDEIRPWPAREALPDSDARTHLDGLVAALRRAAQDIPGTLPALSWVPTKVAAQPGGFVYLLEDEPAQATRLASQLAHFGYPMKTFASASALLEAVERAPPVACLLDIIIADDAQAGIELGQQLHRRDATMPLIFTSARDDIEARLGAVKAGGQAYLTKPIDVGGLVDELDRMTGRLASTPYRVLVVEDDESLARYYRALLRDAGMEAVVESEPLKVLHTLTEFSPDLMLLDIYMPHCSGAELAQVIRQHGAHGGLPIVFLSAEGDPDIQYAALRTGGDDFLTKPVDAKVLLRTIAVRAQRARQMSALMARDGLTGLLNHSRIKEMLIAEVARARRGNTQLALAMLDLDHFKSINDRYGHLTGDRVIKSLARLLRERLRGSDLAGRYGGEEFLVILPDCDRDSALRLIDDIRERFSQVAQCGNTPEQIFNASFSAGLAAFPWANSPENMLLAADAALYEAKLQGRDRTR
ncbi:MAG: diguanylate cyclase [Gallionellaceae bacterium]|nr:diguanylate cyclase [Gallionellaceae bacterium]